MLDSGTVPDFNGIRKGTDVDVLFLSNVDKIILCKFNVKCDCTKLPLTIIETLT
jgi:hypothetical protein